MTTTFGSGSCAKCGQRPGTERWVGEGGSLALSHGFYAMWCEPCVLTAQIEYAEACAARLPGLRDRLAAALFLTAVSPAAPSAEGERGKSEDGGSEAACSEGKA